MKEIKVAIEDGAVLPSRKHEDDAGIDLYAYLPPGYSQYAIEPFQAVIIPTGAYVELEKGYVGLIWPKSKYDFIIGGGVIDAGYQGEILVKIINPTDHRVVIKQGQAIAQMLIQKIETPKVFQTGKDRLYQEASERGDTGGITAQYKQASFMASIESVE